MKKVLILAGLMLITALSAAHPSPGSVMDGRSHK